MQLGTYVETNSFTSFEIVGDAMDMSMKNSSSFKVVGSGTMDLHFTYANTVILKEILYTLHIRKNLVFGSLLIKHGFKMVFKNVFSM